MLYPKEQEADVGVIVGRFQVHELHEGHHSLIQSVLKRHQRVVIFLGQRASVLVTRRNPLDFRTRRLMVQEHYPEVDVLPLPDHPLDTEWSRNLDLRIAEVAEGKSVLLYGSRDSFASAYSGQHPIAELSATKHVSGSAVRKSISDSTRGSSDFRHGVIYAAHQRHATSYQAVDAACIRHQGGDTAALLLCRKDTDPKGQWRFFGGFVQPGVDKSLSLAASRELHEEAGDIGVHSPPTYVGSALIDDWRYRGEEDSIMSALFLFDFMFGTPEARDDVDEVQWFRLTDLKSERFVAEHRPLFDLLCSHLQITHHQGSESK